MFADRQLLLGGGIRGAMMADRKPTFIMFAMIALDARDVTDTYRKMVLAHCRGFARWLGRSVHIDEVNCNDVNKFLAYLKTTKRTPETIDTYRRNILTIWRQAYEDGDNDHAPLRVKRIKKPRKINHAYTLAELRQLVHAASQLKGRHKNGNKRADFWQALIHAAYSTGLRRSDLLLVFKRDIELDGSLTIVQSKTGIPLRVRLSPEALSFSARLRDANGLLLPWPYRRDALVPRFRFLRSLAKINRGSLKWIRRAAGNHAERINPGDGPKLLGHSPAVFRANYEDFTITGKRAVEPPPL